MRKKKVARNEDLLCDDVSSNTGKRCRAYAVGGTKCRAHGGGRDEGAEVSQPGVSEAGSAVEDRSGGLEDVRMRDVPVHAGVEPDEGEGEGEVREPAGGGDEDSGSAPEVRASAADLHMRVPSFEDWEVMEVEVMKAMLESMRESISVGGRVLERKLSAADNDGYVQCDAEGCMTRIPAGKWRSVISGRDPRTGVIMTHHSCSDRCDGIINARLRDLRTQYAR